MDVIEKVVSSRRLTLFAGAGVSADLGLPQWATLVETSLDKLLERARKAGRKEFMVTYGLARQLLKTSFQLPLATTAEQLAVDLAGNREDGIKLRDKILRESLYAKSAGLPTNSLAKELLLLAAGVKILNRQNDIQIVTTNYDDSFMEISQEDAEVENLLRAAGLRFKPYADKVPSGNSVHEIPVVYIHGRIPRKGAVTRPVFSEVDYVHWMHGGGFRDYVAQRFDHGVTLMLGASLRDYNIISFITRTHYKDGDMARIAVLPMQDDPSFERGLSSDFAAIERLRGLRGDALGIQIVTPNYYGQVYQLAHEMQHAVGRLPSAQNSGKIARYVPYINRLENWWSSFTRLKYASDRVRRTTTLALKNQAAQLHADWLHDAEHLKLELWIRAGVTPKHDPRVLELWCNSQSMNLPNTIHWEHHVSLADRHASPAVSAFALRTPFYSEDASRTDRRWTHVVAVPIVLVQPPFYGIPVGVVVLRLHAPESVGQASTPLTLEHLEYINGYLTELGAQALTPQASRTPAK